MFAAGLLPPPGQPQSKAAPTAQLSGPVLVAEVDNEKPQKAHQSEKPHVMPRVIREGNPNESTSLPTTLALIQRVLAPDRQIETKTQTDASGIEDLLPPLTSSDEVDVELYAILAIIIKDFVNTWYSKITSDHGFVEEIIKIFAHCSTSLEQRLRHVDVVSLFVDEIPLLVHDHVEAYRTAKSSAQASPYDSSISQIYHELIPHPALSPFPSEGDLTIVSLQAHNEHAYRQLLTQGALAILLPTEDLQNDALRVLVGDVIADLIIGQALAGKVSHGWFLHGVISKATATALDKVQPKASGSEMRDDAKNRLEKFGLLSTDSKFQHHDSSATDQSRISTWFWRVLQYGYLTYLFLRYMLKELNGARHRSNRPPRAPMAAATVEMSEKVHLHDRSQGNLSPQPVLSFGLCALISTLLKLAARMPWAAGMFNYWQYCFLYGWGQVAAANSLFDRFLYHTIETHVLSPSLLPIVLRNLRIALFPNNAMGPPALPPPSLDEAREIKREAARSISSLIPHLVAYRYYSTDYEEEVLDAIQEDMLDMLDDTYINKHLLYAILELVLMRLIPELGEQTINDLLAERGIIVDDDVATDNPALTEDLPGYE